MKLNFKHAMFAAALATTAGSAMAYDVRIDVNGKLTSSTCEVTAGSSKQATINLPELDVSSLNAAGASSGRKQLDLAVTGCQDTTVAEVHFEPSGVNVTPAGTLRNLATSEPAANVEVQLLDGQSKVLNLNTDTASYAVSGATGTVTLYAQYYSPQGDAQPGNVTSYIEMSMAYR
ncbi:fimbrial protein [Isoalcanivorax beigongshangi]|uniref:Fimbrial protein n=1 Tax=Isoalcanivorax beigongshangi TaxID=3238810 RepID=A0ABV4AF72_9GAMM